jgi:hypothetical protein
LGYVLRFGPGECCSGCSVGRRRSVTDTYSLTDSATLANSDTYSISEPYPDAIAFAFADSYADSRHCSANCQHNVANERRYVVSKYVGLRIGLG